MILDIKHKCFDFLFFIYICYSLRMIEIQRIQMNGLDLQLVYICIVIYKVAEW